MKKVVLLIVALSFATISFARVSNAQIADLISKNVKINNLKNPDLVYPGQPLLFNMVNDMAFVHVQKGENLWIIAKRILVYQEKSKQSVVALNPPIENKKIYVSERKSPDKVIESAGDTFPACGWITIILVVAGLSYLSYKHDKKEIS